MLHLTLASTVKPHGDSIYNLAVDCSKFRLAQSAMAKFVIIGFTPLALGNTDASITYSPRVPQTRQFGSTTLFLADAPIRHVPI